MAKVKLSLYLTKLYAMKTNLLLNKSQRETYWGVEV